MFTSIHPPHNLPFHLILLIPTIISICIPHVLCNKDNLQTYIVHLDQPPSYISSHKEWHQSFLPDDDDRLVHSYGRVFGGFAARLTEEEVEKARSVDGFIHAHLDHALSLDTTRTPTFLGLNQGSDGLWKAADYGKGVIIGVLDNGITPNAHPSFDDKDMPPPPSKWRGTCNFKPPLCNNKIIGARSVIYGSPYESPFDTKAGHGTHAAGIAAGNFVPNASVLGNAKGTAAGVAPGAHLAIYKACVDDICVLSNVLAAIELAVEDGVDVISMSISGSAGLLLWNDALAIASFGAMKRGVLVSTSAGNTGPAVSSVKNTAPWVLTVGASTIDRKMPALVTLGNEATLQGESAYQPISFPKEFFPLVHSPQLNVNFCSNISALERVGARGKVVLCMSGGDLSNIEKGGVVKQAGGVAMVVLNEYRYGSTILAQAHVLPTSEISVADGFKLLEYIKSTAYPKVSLLFMGTTIVPDSLAPSVAGFSSRGPSKLTPGVLKPDIVGPGVNVVAAWPEPVGPFVVDPPFNSKSGTSMSCPHLSGVVALLMARHPYWSPAMIKSAIMTTSYTTNQKGLRIIDQSDSEPASLYDMGAGHVDPVRANNPGLVYDIEPNEYVGYLCALGYNNTQVRIFTRTNLTDCSWFKSLDESSLNYPSISVDMGSSMGYLRQVKRTLTNVGGPKSVYTVSVVSPPNINMTVWPSKLEFEVVGEKKSFYVGFRVLNRSYEVKSLGLEGLLTWVSWDGQIRVRSPVVVTLGSSSQLSADAAGLPSYTLTLD